jgi:putative transposase
LRQAVHHEGEVLESFVTKRRNKKVALKLFRKSLKRPGPAQDVVTDKLRSCSAALRALGISDKQEPGHWASNQKENSHQPFGRRARAKLHFRQM